MRVQILKKHDKLFNNRAGHEYMQVCRAFHMCTCILHHEPVQ